jgi:hypothetical protein
MAHDLVAGVDDTWDPVLAEVFTFLPLLSADALACVSCRWRSLARASHWKPELLLYSWGDAVASGHASSSDAADAAGAGIGSGGGTGASGGGGGASGSPLPAGWVPQPRLLALFYSVREKEQVMAVACGDFYTLALSRGGQVG